jgi:HD-GYP domain-containing protein (c-di-GMP phosphodiesterase class II)
LHDIGKIGIPDAVLLKSCEDLTPREMEEYLKHPIRGQAAVDAIEEFREVGVLIRHHHEWFNGEGFPDRLKGNGIPLGSRIIAVADKLDRLISGDGGMDPVGDGLRKIDSLVRIQFDPDPYSVLTECSRKISSQFSPSGEDQLVYVNPKDLKPGMVISKDVKSGTGLLLLSKGVILDEKRIDAMIDKSSCLI